MFRNVSTWTSRCYITTWNRIHNIETAANYSVVSIENRNRHWNCFTTIVATNISILVSVRLNADTIQKSYLNFISNALYYIYFSIEIHQTFGWMSALASIVSVGSLNFKANTLFLVHRKCVFFFVIRPKKSITKNCGDNRQLEFGTETYNELNVPMKFVCYSIVVVVSLSRSLSFYPLDRSKKYNRYGAIIYSLTVLFNGKMPFQVLLKIKNFYILQLTILHFNFEMWKCACFVHCSWCFSPCWPFHINVSLS